MKLISFIAVAAVGLTAQAKQYSCVGEDVNYTKAAVVVDCDETICSVSGDLQDDNVGPQALDLQDCDARRRDETEAAKFKKLAYFDVQSDSCWADYVRVSKSLLAGDNEGFVSLVKRTGGDQHDSSGYQYANLKCKAR